MCDCISLCICLLSGAVVSYYTFNTHCQNKTIEIDDKEPK